MTEDIPELDLKDPNVRKAKLNTETARIAWKELQRYFASGSAIAVSVDLDLLEVGAEVMADNKARVEGWVSSKEIAPVSDAQASLWYENDQEMWAVVLTPWVFVQPVTENNC